MSFSDYTVVRVLMLLDWLSQPYIICGGRSLANVRQIIHAQSTRRIVTNRTSSACQLRLDASNALWRSKVHVHVDVDVEVRRHPFWLYTVRISSFGHMTFLLWLSSFSRPRLLHPLPPLISFIVLFFWLSNFSFITELRRFLSVLHILRFSCRRRHPVRGILTYLLAIAGF